MIQGHRRAALVLKCVKYSPRYRKGSTFAAVAVSISGSMTGVVGLYNGVVGVWRGICCRELAHK